MIIDVPRMLVKSFPCVILVLINDLRTDLKYVVKLLIFDLLAFR